MAMIEVDGSIDIEIKERSIRWKMHLDNTRSTIHDGIIVSDGTVLFF